MHFPRAGDDTKYLTDGMKVCKHCKNNLSTVCFKESPNSDDGLFPFCLMCEAALARNHAGKLQQLRGS